MTYHRDVLAKEIMLVLLAAKPDFLPGPLAQRSFEIADAMLAEANRVKSP